MAESDLERTEAPTPRRRQEARRDGNVARSGDLTSAGILLAAVLLLYVFGADVLGGLKVTVETMLSGSLSANPTRADDVGAIAPFLGQTVLVSLLPLVMGISAVGLVFSAGQVGLLLTGKPLVPNFGRISPLRGVKNLFDARSLMRLGMSLGKIAVIAGIAGVSISHGIVQITRLGELTAAAMVGVVGRMVFLLALKLAGALLLLALIDYAFQRWKHERDLRMSKQEVKDEMKRMEGDPMIKQRRTRVARQLALQRINQAVPGADVIVTNPTHFAVALRYDSQQMAAPKVVAKGADFLAMRIRQIAAANGVPIVERKELARALYKAVEVGQEIPPQFFGAVAEILAYVYRLSGRKTA